MHRVVGALYDVAEDEAQVPSVVRRRFSRKGVLDYSPGSGRAAALVPGDGSTLEVVAGLGMRWLPGKVVSWGSLRGLKTLGKGGGSWS